MKTTRGCRVRKSAALAGNVYMKALYKLRTQSVKSWTAKICREQIGMNNRGMHIRPSAITFWRLIIITKPLRLIFNLQRLILTEKVL